MPAVESEIDLPSEIADRLEEYSCPINMELMVEPVTLYCGHSFEKDAIEEVGVVNDQVGDEAVLIAWDPSTETVRGYSRQVDTAVLTFTQGDDFLVDDQTGSLWNYEGEAVSGDYRGRTLSSLVLENSFWFSWAASHPNTELFTSNE